MTTIKFKDKYELVQVLPLIMDALDRFKLYATARSMNKTILEAGYELAHQIEREKTIQLNNLRKTGHTINKGGVNEYPPASPKPKIKPIGQYPK